MLEASHFTVMLGAIEQLCAFIRISTDCMRLIGETRVAGPIYRCTICLGFHLSKKVGLMAN